MLLIYLLISHHGVEEDKEPIAPIGDHKDVGGHIVANIPVYFSSRCIGRQRANIAPIADHNDVGGHIVANIPVYFCTDETE